MYYKKIKRQQYKLSLSSQKETIPNMFHHFFVVTTIIIITIINITNPAIIV
jgi:hypothetical protein